MQQSSVGYHMSVTRLPTATDVAEQESGSCYICPESVRRILTTMLDISLLKSPSFLILAISGGLTMMGFYTPFMYVPGIVSNRFFHVSLKISLKREIKIHKYFFCLLEYLKGKGKKGKSRCSIFKINQVPNLGRGKVKK